MQHVDISGPTALYCLPGGEFNRKKMNEQYIYLSFLSFVCLLLPRETNILYTF